MNNILKAFLLAASLSGCASYHARPLAANPAFAQRLEVDRTKLDLPGLAAHRFDPSDGLDMTEVAMLAVSNNPDLRLARDRAGISGAQVYAAGLLPDPRISLTPQLPQNGAPGENIRTFDFGISEDVGAILMRSSRVGIAGAEKKKADLALLWQEWQVVEQSRLLFSRIESGEERLLLLKRERKLWESALSRERDAEREGNLALAPILSRESALLGIEKSVDDLARQVRGNRNALNALLGLSPDTKLGLAGGADLPGLDRKAVSARLAKLPQVRPDLLALRAGYDAQDLRLRQAILGQFPSFELGFVRSRDNTGIRYLGFSIGMSLPILNRNRGNIAIESATREMLRDEYRNRIDSAWREVGILLEEQSILEKRLAALKPRVAQMEREVDSAKAAYGQGDMTISSFADLENAGLTARSEEQTIEENLVEGRIALQTLLVLPMKGLQ